VGFQNKDEMWKMADIGLCTSDSEGMPLSLIEAQMAGVPVVSTDVGSVSEIVIDGMTGKLARDLPGLIEGIRWVKNSISNSDDLGIESRKHALANFTTEKVASSHLELYKEVLDKVGR
ncbi:MAG: glycosyltransferase family 4 protein, partial [Actinobacteria bacterium]|nr:glycosyltransferase family 4 protein [Actinomycetota bacterium]